MSVSNAWMSLARARGDGNRLTNGLSARSAAMVERCRCLSGSTPSGLMPALGLGFDNVKGAGRQKPGTPTIMHRRELRTLWQMSLLPRARGKILSAAEN
jgi:hypothetical protein